MQSIVVIPGIQGRWEYVRPAIDALSASFQVHTFSLRGERLDDYADQVSATLDRAQIERATICGVSFGGLPAIRFAARHPDRTAALVLVSVPGPGWRLRPRHRLYARAPWLLGPLFLAESPFRLRDELRAAFPSLAARSRFVRWQLGTFMRVPLSLARMADRAALTASSDLRDDCAKVTAPALIVTGERGLDRVVQVDGTLAYLRLIAGARHQTIESTGHLGSITRPETFASIVREFVENASRVQKDPAYLNRRAKAPRHNSEATSHDSDAA